MYPCIKVFVYRLVVFPPSNTVRSSFFFDGGRCPGVRLRLRGQQLLGFEERVSNDRGEYVPVLITPIDPPIVVQMHPASGLGSVLQAGNYIESADPSSLFDTLIAPHIVGDKDGSFVGIKCSYLDLNVEGRYWKNSNS